MSNQGLIRALKRIEKNSKTDLPEKKKDLSLLLSMLAIFISMLTIYFQFFYYHYDLNASFVGGGVENDTLHFQIIYHNKGNQDATIIKSQIWYYSDSNKDKPENHFGFKNKFKDPFILTSGNQKFYEILEPANFQIFDFNENETNSNDTLRIQIQFRFMNDNNLLSEKETTVGWITLDSLKKINYYSLTFENLNLQTDSYISGAFRKK